MRTNPFALSCFALAVAACVTVPQARANTVLVIISPDTLVGNPGDVLRFFGTLANTTASPVFINGDTFVFGPGILDDSPFLLGPAALGPNEVSSSFEMFDVTIPVNLAPATYNGTFNVEGGPDSNADELLGTAAFHVEVDSGTAVPEPSPAALVLLGAAMLLWPLGKKFARVWWAVQQHSPVLEKARVDVRASQHLYFEHADRAFYVFEAVKRARNWRGARGREV